MSDILQNPAVQSAIAPFLACLLASSFLVTTRLGACVVGVGLLSMVALTTGLSFRLEALTSFNKLVLVSVLGMALIPLIQKISGNRHIQLALLLAFAGLGALWMGSRVIGQAQGAQLALTIAGVAGYAIALNWNAGLHARAPIISGSWAVALGLCTATLALLGASAILAFTGIAVAAACGAHLLVQLTWRKSPENNTLALHATLVCTLAALAAVLTGQLKWYALLPTLLIPLAARIPHPANRPPVAVAFLAGLAALVPAVLAVALAWLTSGSNLE